MKRTSEKKFSDESVDRLGSDMINAFRASEAEINSVADSRELFNRLRARINSELDTRVSQTAPLPENKVTKSRLLAWFTTRPMIWGLASALTILLITALVLTAKRADQQAIEQAGNKTVNSSDTTSVPSSPARSSSPASPVVDQTPGQNDALASSNDDAIQNKIIKSPKHANRRVRAVSKESNEMATEYLPLTLSADLGDSDGGQIIRISLPRSALASFGLPVNPELANEVVRADVVMGDDGLARAIRLLE